MFNGNETTHKGEGWKVTVDQYSNKGPIILVENGEGEELFRVLYDVVTRRLQVLINSIGKRVETKL